MGMQVYFAAPFVELKMARALKKVNLVPEGTVILLKKMDCTAKRKRTKLVQHSKDNTGLWAINKCLKAESHVSHQDGWWEGQTANDGACRRLQSKKDISSVLSGAEKPLRCG